MTIEEYKQKWEKGTLYMDKDFYNTYKEYDVLIVQLLRDVTIYGVCIFKKDDVVIFCLRNVKERFDYTVYEGLMRHIDSVAPFNEVELTGGGFEVLCEPQVRI